MDERQWYYLKNRQQLGPVPEAELLELFRRGELDLDTYVWNEEFTDWKKASQINQFASLPAHQQAEPVVAQQSCPPPRPTSVTVLGILNIIFGSLGLICAPFSMAFIFIDTSGMDPTWVARGWLIFSHLLGICLSGLLLALGIGLLRLRLWAGKWTLIYGWFAIGWNILGTAINLVLILSGAFGYTEQAMPEAIGATLGGLVGGMIYPVILIVFMKKPNVKDACTK